MPLMGCSLDEVRSFISEIEKVQKRIRQDEEYRSGIIEHERQYKEIKEYFISFSSFLQYREEVTCGTFYRVRKSEAGTPYTTIKDLKYPDADVRHQDRMNNTSSRVLYTSLHEFTAMSECRIDSEFVGRKFQLTRFGSDKQFNVYRLGLFSELYLNNPRDSDFVKNRAQKFLGPGSHDRTIQGYSALEIALANILYDQENNHHILSSVLADAIFSANADIDAIMYPSMQNRYGINVAFKKEFADALKIEYSSLNTIDHVYPNGFFQYSTELECVDFSLPDKLTYGSLNQRVTYR